MADNNRSLVEYFSFKYNEWREGRVTSVSKNKKGFDEYEIVTTSSDPFLRTIKRKEGELKFKH